MRDTERVAAIFKKFTRFELHLLKCVGQSGDEVLYVGASGVKWGTQVAQM